MSDFDEAFESMNMNILEAKDKSGNLVQVISGLSFEDYLAIDAANNSRLGLLDKSPLHYQANPGQSATRSMGLGTLIHCAVLEPDKMAKRYMSAPAGMRQDKRTKVYKEFLSAVPSGIEVISQRDHQTARDIASDINSDPMLERFWGKGESELTVIWTDADSGVPCKIRIDRFVPGVGFLDLKSTQDCTASQFPWSAKKYGYFRQAAFYRRGIMAAQAVGLLPPTGEDVPCYFLAVETGQVRAHALYAMPDNELTVFHDQVSDKLETIRACQESDTWPGPNGMHGAPLPLTFPGYLAIEDDENAEADNGVGEDWGE